MKRGVYLVTSKGTKDVFRVFPLSSAVAETFETDHRERLAMMEENGAPRAWHSLGYILRARKESWEG